MKTMTHCDSISSGLLHTRARLNRVVRAAAAVAWAIAVPFNAPASQPPSTQSNAELITIVLKENFSEEGVDAVVQIERRGPTREVVALRRLNASPELFQLALSGLVAARLAALSDTTSDVTFVVREGTQHRRLSEGRRATLLAVLRRLESQPEVLDSRRGRLRELSVPLVLIGR